MTLFDLEMTLRGQKQISNPPHIERESIELVKRGYLLVTKNAIRSFLIHLAGRLYMLKRKSTYRAYITW